MYKVEFWSELLRKFVFKQYEDLSDALSCATQTGGKVVSENTEEVAR